MTASASSGKGILKPSSSPTPSRQKNSFSMPLKMKTLERKTRATRKRMSAGMMRSPLEIVGRNQVVYGRCGARRKKTSDPFLVQPVRLGDAFVLAKMFEP